MLICDRCAGKQFVRSTDVPVSLADKNVPTLYKPMDLCTNCRDAFKDVMQDFVKELPRDPSPGI